MPNCPGIETTVSSQGAALTPQEPFFPPRRPISPLWTDAEDEQSVVEFQEQTTRVEEK